MREYNDAVQRFMFEHASIRGEMVHLDEAYQTIMQQRVYPAMVKQLLGEALVSCVLLAGSMKFEGEISLQFQGDARLPLLLVQCDHNLQIRGFANYAAEDVDVDYAAAFLDGKMALTISPSHQTQSYQSVVPIESLSMSDNITNYFAQSEQLSSRVWLAVAEHNAAGMLLQWMPETGSKNTQAPSSEQREEFWSYALHMGETLREDELLTLDNQTILHRLYHETELRLYPARPVQFHCRCSHEKMQAVLRVLGEHDLQQLLQEQGVVEVLCDFCNRRYAFDPIDVALLFRDHAAAVDQR